MEFLITVLTVYGISAIVTQSKIFEPFRDLAEKKSPDFWYHLSSCMQCFPFWAGIFVCLVLDPPVLVNKDLLPAWTNTFLTYLFCGALLSGTTMVLHALFIHLLGDVWQDKQEKERLRKANKDIPGSKGGA